jgi:DNA-binding transcriptional MerR regulator
MKGRTISKLAKEAGVGVETIRFYERRGILKQPPAPPAGWRQYSQEALSTIRYIKIGQQLGFKLSEIAGLQAKASGGQQSFCESVRNATRSKIKAVEQQIEQLQNIHRELLEFLGSCSAKKASDPCPIYNTLGADKTRNERRSSTGDKRR